MVMMSVIVAMTVTVTVTVAVLVRRGYQDPGADTIDDEAYHRVQRFVGGIIARPSPMPVFRAENEDTNCHVRVVAVNNTIFGV